MTEVVEGIWWGSQRDFVDLSKATREDFECCLLIDDALSTKKAVENSRHFFGKQFPKYSVLHVGVVTEGNKVEIENRLWYACEIIKEAKTSDQYPIFCTDFDVNGGQFSAVVVVAYLMLLGMTFHEAERYFAIVSRQFNLYQPWMSVVHDLWSIRESTCIRAQYLRNKHKFDEESLNELAVNIDRRNSVKVKNSDQQRDGKWIRYLDRNTEREFLYDPVSGSTVWASKDNDNGKALLDLVLEEEEEEEALKRKNEETIPSNSDEIGLGKQQDNGTKTSDGGRSGKGVIGSAFNKMERKLWKKRRRSSYIVNETGKWKKYKDPATAKIFVYNAETKESKWLVETDPDAEAASDDDKEVWKNRRKSSIRLEKTGDWTKYKDRGTNREFWHNKVTGESRWEKPRGLVGNFVNLMAGEQGQESVDEFKNSLSSKRLKLKATAIKLTVLNQITKKEKMKIANNQVSKNDVKVPPDQCLIFGVASKPHALVSTPYGKIDIWSFGDVGAVTDGDRSDVKKKSGLKQVLPFLASSSYKDVRVVHQIDMTGVGNPCRLILFNGAKDISKIKFCLMKNNLTLNFQEIEMNDKGDFQSLRTLCSIDASADGKKAQKEEQNLCCCLAFHEKKKQFVTVTGDSYIRLWSYTESISLPIITAKVSSPYTIKDIKIREEGKLFLVHRATEPLELWKRSTLSKSCTLEYQRNEDLSMTCVDYSNHGKLIAGGTRSGETLVWNIDETERTLVRRLQELTGFPITILKFSPCNRFLVTASRAIILYDSTFVGFPRLAKISLPIYDGSPCHFSWSRSFNQTRTTFALTTETGETLVYTLRIDEILQSTFMQKLRSCTIV
eukprot:g1612.t1